MKFSTTARRSGAAIALAFALGAGITSPSFALPPGGASTVNTAGTNSTIQTTKLKAGDVLKFTLTGFPAGEQVYVKVDNGSACPSDAAQGACVVHQQKADSNGTVNGSFILPKDLADGEHTLRFLATKVMKDSSGNQIGTEGYTNESPTFTISGVNENSAGGTTRQVDASEINQTNTNSQSSGSNGSSSNNSGSNSNSGSNNSQGNNSSSNENNGSNNSNNSGGSESQNKSGDSNSSEQGNQNNQSDTSENSDGAEEETVYMDADGNVISEEEYNRLMNENPSAASTSKASDSKATAAASGKATQTASSSASSSSDAKESKSAVEATNASDEESGNSVPWVGIIAVVIAAVVAAAVLVNRRRNG